MKQIAVTQRVDVIDSYKEKRDSADQRWCDLMLTCGLMPLFVPNNSRYLEIFLKTYRIDGVLLTGGNSLIRYGGNAPERDLVEFTLLEYAIQRRIPVLGVCRGMQIIQDYFGVTLEPVLNHVSVRHRLTINDKSRIARILNQIDTTVNSYHEYGTFYSNDELIIAAVSDDGVVMAIEHREYPIYGQMWHSERESSFYESELNVFREVYCQKFQKL